MNSERVICNQCGKPKNGVQTELCNHCGRFGKNNTELAKAWWNHYVLIENYRNYLARKYFKKAAKELNSQQILIIWQEQFLYPDKRERDIKLDSLKSYSTK
jgi:ribosomal protein L37E